MSSVARAAGDVAGQHHQHLAGRPVGPVDVLDDEDDRRLLGAERRRARASVRAAARSSRRPTSPQPDRRCAAGRPRAAWRSGSPPRAMQRPSCTVPAAGRDVTDQARLADPRLSDDGQRAAAASAGPLEGLLKRGDGARPSDQRCVGGGQHRHASMLADRRGVRRGAPGGDAQGRKTLEEGVRPTT